MPQAEARPVEIKQEIVVEKTDLPSKCIPYLDEIKKYDWDTEMAGKIMFAESSCDPEALNNNPKTGDYSVGLMQINLHGKLKELRPAEKELKDPSKNIAFAYELYKARGFQPWTTYKKLL